MKLNSLGVPTPLIALVVTACATPAMMLNVWPRVETMLAHGMTSNDLGIVALVTLSALGMTAVPFAMQKSPNWGFWATCLAFGIGLAILNYIMAVGAIGKFSDHATAQATTIIIKAQQLQARVEELKTSRKELGSFKPTSQEMLQAADEAIKLATEARDQECGKVGDFCRARVAQLQSRLSERAEIATHRALTLDRERNSRELRETIDQLDRLGNLPTYSDPQAERIARLLQWFAPSIATPAVANGIIHMLAIAAELFALGMPRILVAALGRPEIPVGGLPLKLASVSVGQISASNKRRPRMIAPPRNTPPAPTDTTREIIDWMGQHLLPQKGSLVKCWDAWKHFEAQATNPGTFTAFDFDLQQLSVRKEVGSRSFYVDVSLKK